jgi:predicted nuclease of predicted toxin-antitoxin system
MRLLFDHNLSPRLVRRLADLYPDTSHVFFVGLDRAADMTVWNYAQTYDYIIVTKDSDFSDVSVLRGFPPKVVWLRLGNCTTTDVERTLRHGFAAIEAFANDPTSGVLELI